MTSEANEVSTSRVEVVKAQGEEPVCKAGDAVTISLRFPIGHFCVPNYIRGQRAWIESVIEPPAINNEKEGYGRKCWKQAALQPGCHSIERTLAALRRLVK